MKSVLIAGGSGYIGKHLAEYLNKSGYSVSILSRSKVNIAGVTSYFWNPEKEQIDYNSLKNQQIIINLAGAGIGEKLWTPSRKREIINSRIEPLELLFDQIIHLNNKPEKIISASAIGYYGNRPGEKLSEESLAGSGFLPQVCIQWEKAVQKFEVLPVPVCILRIGVVASKDAISFNRLKNSLELGINLTPGNGKQLISWIALHDLLSAIQFLIDNKELNGVFNLTNPNPLSMRDVQTELAELFKLKTININIPSFLIKAIIGSFSELMLNDQEVIPQRLLDLGFHFNYTTISKSIQ
jgi:uncharacterized protein (TIGR01777 family)